MKPNDPNQITRHHRKPRCQGGDNTDDNVIKVPRNKHESFHLLFNEGDPEYIAKVLNETWINPEYEVRIVKRK